MSTSGAAYLLAGQPSELERLQLQSRVWEPAGRAPLDRLGGGRGLRALDVGCGCFGWLRLLSQWVGPNGSVTAHVDAKLLDAARALIKEDRLGNVTLVHDDLFDSKLEPHTFDLVHSRFEIGPLVSRHRSRVNIRHGMLQEDRHGQSRASHPRDRGRPA